MKKILTFVACVAMATMSFAQVPFIIKGGVGISNYCGSDADGSSAKFAYKLGVGTELPLGGNISLQPSLYFVEKGAKSDLGGVEIEGISGKLTVHAQYLELPVMFAYRTEVGDNMNVVFNAGPYFAYGISGKTKFGNSGVSVSTDTFSDDQLKRFDAGIGLGVAGEFNRFVVGVDGQIGLAKVMKDTDTHNLSFFVTLGYKF